MHEWKWSSKQQRVPKPKPKPKGWRDNMLALRRPDIHHRPELLAIQTVDEPGCLRLAAWLQVDV
jgi:hypothetical protein